MSVQSSEALRIFRPDEGEDRPNQRSGLVPSLRQGTIYFLSENDVVDSVNQKEVNEAIEACFSSLAAEDAFNFPVVRQALGYSDAIFGFKSGFDLRGPSLGIKAGGLWPGNKARGLANHQSTIVLFDPDSGAPAALICGTYLTALRTASASALSVRYLARENVQTLGVTATGGQASYQVRASLAERSFTRLLLPQRASGSSERLQAELADLDLQIDVLPMEDLCRQSDVLITVALSFSAYVQRSWIAPGTHIACMGTDTRGKQELEASLVAASTVFGDAPDQNALLGECQHAVDKGLLDESQITPLGKVINGLHSGRRSDDEVTLFDSTGMGMQDLAAASLTLHKAQQCGHFTALSQQGA
ncbi:MAG: ornithine cyclodeaminase family protein [Pseudomonadota bacterium]